MGKPLQTTHTHVQMYTHTSASCPHMHVWGAHTSSHVCTCACPCMRAHTHMQTHTGAGTHTCIHMPVHTQAPCACMCTHICAHAHTRSSYTHIYHTHRHTLHRVDRVCQQPLKRTNTHLYACSGLGFTVATSGPCPRLTVGTALCTGQQCRPYHTDTDLTEQHGFFMHPSPESGLPLPVFRRTCELTKLGRWWDARCAPRLGGSLCRLMCRDREGRTQPWAGLSKLKEVPVSRGSL